MVSKNWKNDKLIGIRLIFQTGLKFPSENDRDISWDYMDRHKDPS